MTRATSREPRCASIERLSRPRVPGDAEERASPISRQPRARRTAVPPGAPVCGSSGRTVAAAVATRESRGSGSNRRNFHGARRAEGKDTALAGASRRPPARDRRRAGERQRLPPGAREPRVRRAGARRGEPQDRVRVRHRRVRIRDRDHVVTTQGAAELPCAERAERAKALRSEVPRSSHAAWDPPPDRPDPVALLEDQARVRVPELVPIRYRRMAESPMTFFRGAAYVMASDLTGTPATGFQVQLSGDAHLANFGGFATPERDLVFD